MIRDLAPQHMLSCSWCAVPATRVLDFPGDRYEPARTIRSCDWDLHWLRWWRDRAVGRAPRDP